MKSSAAIISTTTPDREASDRALTHRSHRQARLRAATGWLRHAWTDWERAWALAAGVSPHLFP